MCNYHPLTLQASNELFLETQIKTAILVVTISGLTLSAGKNTMLYRARKIPPVYEVKCLETSSCPLYYGIGLNTV